MRRNPPETAAGLAPDVTGVLLAGGKSTRMGRDKALLPWEGAPMAERIIAMLRTLFPAVLIAGDRPDLARPDVPCVPDIYPGSALGGLYTGLLAAATPWIFVVPCDLPNPDPALVRALLARREGYDVVVPLTPEGMEPLVACYHKSCLEPMRAMLERGEYRVYDLYPELRTRFVKPEELPPGWRKALRNVNTPADLAGIGEGE